MNKTKPAVTKSTKAVASAPKKTGSSMSSGMGSRQNASRPTSPSSATSSKASSSVAKSTKPTSNLTRPVSVPKTKTTPVGLRPNSKPILTRKVRSLPSESKPVADLEPASSKLSTNELDSALNINNKKQLTPDQFIPVGTTADNSQKNSGEQFIQSNNESTKGVTPALEVISLTKWYGGRKAPAVKEISFKVMPGEFHAFIGANGAGKTTTMKSIVGAYGKFEGTVRLYGEDNRTGHSKIYLGYIPERAVFPKGMNLMDYLVSMGRLIDIDKKRAVEKAKLYIAELGLKGLENKYPYQFSSGQSRKALLAQALMHDPKLLVMDEPAANLDPKARIEFFDILRKLQKSGTAIFISSHILSELDKYADSVTMIDGGQVVLTGNLSDIMARSESQYVLSTNDNGRAAKILDGLSVSYIFDHVTDIQVQTSDRNLARKILKEIIKDGLEVDKWVNTQTNLETLYQKMIIKGSVDTMDKNERGNQ